MLNTLISTGNIDRISGSIISASLTFECMKLSIDTIIIFVQDIDRLKVFYTTTLNLPVIEEIASGWLLLRAGHCNIGLHKMGEQYLGGNEATRRTDHNTKIVFEVDEDLVALRARLLRENVSLKEIKTFDNYDFWVCDGHDPEGNAFQLKQKK